MTTTAAMNQPTIRDIVLHAVAMASTDIQPARIEVIGDCAWLRTVADAVADAMHGDIETTTASREGFVSSLWVNRGDYSVGLYCKHSDPIYADQGDDGYDA